MLRTVLGVIATLIGAALLLLSVGAYFFSTFCWEYCEPEDEPTAWEGLQFALPFGLVAIWVMMVAVTFVPGRAGIVAAGGGRGGRLVPLGGAIVIGFGALWDDLPAAEVVGAALVAVWAALTGVAARRLAVRS